LDMKTDSKEYAQEFAEEFKSVVVLELPEGLDLETIRRIASEAIEPQSGVLKLFDAEL